LGNLSNDLIGKEGMVANVASRIFSAYMAQGRVSAENSFEWMDRSIRLAIRLSKRTEEMVQKDAERSSSRSKERDEEFTDIFCNPYDYALKQE